MKRRSGRKVAPDRTPVGQRSVPNPAVTLTTDHILRLLRRPETGKEFPALAATSFLMRKQKKPRAGCSRCVRMVKRAKSTLCRKAMHIIAGMAPARQEKVKAIVGIRGRMRIEYSLDRLTAGGITKGKVRRCLC